MKLCRIITRQTGSTWLTVWVICAYFVTRHVTEDVQSDGFQERTVCGVGQRLAIGCLRLVSSVPVSRVQCAVWCQHNATACLGIVVNQTGSCFFNYGCGDLETTAACSGEDASFTGYDKPKLSVSPCHNGGLWQENSQVCLCGPYSSGNLCESTPEACEDLRNWGLPNGIHLVEINVLGNPVKVKVKCELGLGFVNTHVSHNNGTSDYNATYQEYKDGFYKGDSAFWLGLENMYRLTDDLVEDLVVVMVINGVEVRQTYRDFEVENESHEYEVDFDTITMYGNALNAQIGRCMYRDTPFSTWDRDKDARTNLNIANATGSGWWYTKEDMRFCNLNGIKPLDHSNKMNYVSAEWMNLSLSVYGTDFESTTIYLEHLFL